MRSEGAAAIWPDTRPNDEPQAPRSLVGISEFSKLSASSRAHPMAPHRPPTRSLAAGAEIAMPPRGQAPREEISDHRASQRPSGASRPGVKNSPQFRRRENLVGGRGSTARGPKFGPPPPRRGKPRRPGFWRSESGARKIPAGARLVWPGRQGGGWGGYIPHHPRRRAGANPYPGLDRTPIAPDRTPIAGHGLGPDAPPCGLPPRSSWPPRQ